LLLGRNLSPEGCKAKQTGLSWGGSGEAIIYVRESARESDMFEKEMRYFESHRGELIGKFDGQFVLINEEQIAGGFTKLKDAYNEGVARYGRGLFMIRRVVSEDPITFIPARPMTFENADYL
jgi:hypothetical protein